MFVRQQNKKRHVQQKHRRNTVCCRCTNLRDISATLNDAQKAQTGVVMGANKFGQLLRERQLAVTDPTPRMKSTL